MSVPISKKFPQGVLKILHLREWDGQPKTIMPPAMAITGAKAQKRFQQHLEKKRQHPTSCFRKD